MTVCVPFTVLKNNNKQTETTNTNIAIKIFIRCELSSKCCKCGSDTEVLCHIGMSVWAQELYVSALLWKKQQHIHNITFL